MLKVVRFPKSKVGSSSCSSSQLPPAAATATCFSFRKPDLFQYNSSLFTAIGEIALPIGRINCHWGDSLKHYTTSCVQPLEKQEDETHKNHSKPLSVFHEPSSYNAKLQPYGAKLQPYGAKLQPYSAKLQSYSAKLQSYSATLQSYSAKLQPYRAKLQPYRAKSVFYSQIFLFTHQ